MEELNVGNIHAGEGKEKISQFLYLGAEDKEDLRTLEDKYNVKFNTKISPVSSDGEQYVEVLKQAIRK